MLKGISVVLLAFLVMGSLCILFTILGKRLSKKLENRYNYWRNSRNAVTEKPNNDPKYINCQRGSKRINNTNQTIIKSIPNKLKKDKYNNRN